MRVKDLIKKLEEQNQDAEIELLVPSFQDHNTYISHYQKLIDVFEESHHCKKFVVLQLLRS